MTPKGTGPRPSRSARLDHMGTARVYKSRLTVIDPPQRRLRRSIVSWISLFLLAINLLGNNALAARAAPSHPTTPDLFVQDFLNEQIVICTALGLVALDRDGHPINNGGAGHSDICIFCLPLMHGAVAALAQQMTPLPFAGPTTIRAVRHAAPAPAHPARPAGSASSRGPPSPLT